MDARLPTSHLVKQADADLNTDVGRRIAALAALMFASGTIGRTALGAERAFNLKPLPGTTTSGYDQISLPLPEEKKRDIFSKAADDEAAEGGLLRRTLDSVGEGLGTLIGKSPFPGNKSTHVLGHPATYAIGLPAGLAALYGGYKLTDAVLDRRRKASQQAELDDIKQRYNALVAKSLKRAAAVEDATPAAILDDMADAFLKTAKLEANSWKGNPNPTFGDIAKQNIGWDPTAQLNNAGGAMYGMYPAYALLAALGAGKLSHSYFNKRAPSKITEQALAERERQRSNRQPLYITG